MNIWKKLILIITTLTLSIVAGITTSHAASVNSDSRPIIHLPLVLKVPMHHFPIAKMENYKDLKLTLVKVLLKRWG